MGASFLCHEAGILPATIDNSAAYLRSWVNVLKGDSRLVVRAAGAAQKAADWLLSRQPATAEQTEGAAWLSRAGAASSARAVAGAAPASCASYDQPSRGF